MELLPKEGKLIGSPLAYHSICLLDEENKMLKRIRTARLVLEHLPRDGPDLIKCQFGFWVSRSTVDAIRRVQGLVMDEFVSHRRVILVVSLDVGNAFNSLS